MANRRRFLKSTALLSAGVLTGRGALAALAGEGGAVLFGSSRKHPEIGLQLYTVRDQMSADPRGTLTKVAQIGYNTVEAAIYSGTQKFYGMDPQTFLGVLNDDGLKMLSSHYRLGEDPADGVLQGTILHGWDKAIEDAKAAGAQYMVCAWLSPAERGSLDHFKKLAEYFNTAGQKCKAAGIQFCYHNHDFEFAAQDGVYPYDVLLTNTDPDAVKMEMDLYWVTKGGQDPVAYFQKYPGRFALWHVKDMDNTPKKSFTEVGNGVIDFKRIFAHKKEAGMRHFFVEQDACPGSPFVSITESYNYISKNLV